MSKEILDINVPLYIGEEMGDYEPTYYCMNCGQDLKYEHQEKCDNENCGQLQLWTMVQ